MLRDYVKFWRSMSFDGPTFGHPRDSADLLNEYSFSEIFDFESFCASSEFGKIDDKRLHLSLMPEPHSGNIGNADVVILMLNPGFGIHDYFAEYQMPGFQKRLRNSICQDFSNEEYPFIWLDPSLCWHGGFQYWEGKLRHVLVKLAAKHFKGKYSNALKALSRRLALVQLMPYHSARWGAGRLIRRLKSCEMQIRLVQEYLFQEAQAGRKVLIVARGAKTWGLPNHSNIVVYNGSEARRAHLSLNSKGGRAILKALEKR